MQRSEVGHRAPAMYRWLGSGVGAALSKGVRRQPEKNWSARIGFLIRLPRAERGGHQNGGFGGGGFLLVLCLSPYTQPTGGVYFWGIASGCASSV